MPIYSPLPPMPESHSRSNTAQTSHQFAFCGLFVLTLLFSLLHPGSSHAADESETSAVRMPVDEEGLVVNFERDIAPIFRQHCLECHGAEEAKADFRVDDRDTVFGYVFGEDLESSSMYIDYLISEDDDMLMPPRSHGGPLSPAELALIRIWIEEGANWPDEANVVQPDLDGSGQPIELADGIRKGIDPTDAGLLARVWSFQGFLHPATVHFPIALFLVGGLFVVLGWKWPALGAQVPLVCLLLGAATAIVATMMGWSFSVEKGYGSWTKVNFDSELFWHRWSAIIVTVLSTIFAIIALKSLRSDDEAGRQRLTNVWKIGLLVVAGMVGAVGHQGGELTYGKDFYPKAISILLGKPWPPESAPETAQESESEEEQSPEITLDAVPTDSTVRLDTFSIPIAIQSPSVPSRV